MPKINYILLIYRNLFLTPIHASKLLLLNSLMEFLGTNTDIHLIYYIDLSVREFPSLKTVVFTGGECTLIGIQRLARCIKYATDRGLRTRIVTNGHWGTTYCLLLVVMIF